jgi:CHAT domain-containing protein/Tfp pilus assembly protein PilF
MKYSRLNLFFCVSLLALSLCMGLLSSSAESREGILMSSKDSDIEVNSSSEMESRKKLNIQLRETLNSYFEQLKTYKSLKDTKSEAIIINNIGSVYSELGDYQRALDLFAQALPLAKSIDDSVTVANILTNSSRVYSALGDKYKALEYLTESLTIFKSFGDQKDAAIVLNNIGLIYSDLSESQKALEYYNQALPIYRSIGDQGKESLTINNIGFIYAALGENEKALEYYNQALPIFRSIGNKKNEGLVINNIGLVYAALGKTQKALEYYAQALPIFSSLGNQKGVVNVLNNIGAIYITLGVYEKALNYFFQSQLISKSIGDKEGLAKTLNNIGFVYSKRGDKEKAIEQYAQAFPVFKSIGDQKNEGTVLINIGLIYSDLGESQKALEYYNQALPILRSIGDQRGVAVTLNNIGTIYQNVGEKQIAIEYYSQALPILRTVGDREEEANTFNNIGTLLATQNRPELAIFFLKESVNSKQSLRRNISGLPKSIQDSYSKLSASSYRKLASLLLQQGRILEAQQVLDLLKTEEINEYFHDDKRGNNQTQQNLIFLRPEQKILDQFNLHLKSAIQIGQEQSQLRSISLSGKTLSAQQQQRLIQLDKLQTEIKSQFNIFVDSPQIQKLTAQLSSANQQQIPLDIFDKLRRNLTKLGNAALVYPLILDDRIELIITTSDAPPLRRTVKVTRAQLNQAILDFRNALEFPNLDAKPIANKLYHWLIEPLESDLKQANVHTIIYAPDGPLRYIPLAALYDGKEWIAQRFAVNSITAASIMDLDPNNKSAPLRLLAGAFANEKLSYRIKVGDQVPLTFNGLPFAGKEVNDLATIIPHTDKRIDQAFSLKTLKATFNEYSILHFATHAAFFPGNPEDSFILFGDGENATLKSVENWSLNGVDLVVLSACESGLGIESSADNPKPKNIKLGSGSEILGLGYQFQHSGARATIASLWSVDDGGTQSLMSSFYKLLSKGSISKVEALRQAQVELISGKVIGQSNQNLSNPHYWAPFFLIGNGL